MKQIETEFARYFALVNSDSEEALRAIAHRFGMEIGLLPGITCEGCVQRFAFEPLMHPSKLEGLQEHADRVAQLYRNCLGAKVEIQIGYVDYFNVVIAARSSGPFSVRLGVLLWSRIIATREDDFNLIATEGSNLRSDELSFLNSLMHREER